MTSGHDPLPHELLGVGPDATPEEVHQALERLNQLLVPGSLAFYSVLSPDEQRELHERIRRAATLLLAGRSTVTSPPCRADHPARPVDGAGDLVPDQPVAAEPAAVEPIPAQAEDPAAGTRATPGARLRAAREARSLGLREVAARTRIPVSHLANIEAEAYAELPVRAYARGFVRTYASLLNLDPDALWQGYAARWDSTIAGEG